MPHILYINYVQSSNDTWNQLCHINNEMRTMTFNKKKQKKLNISKKKCRDQNPTKPYICKDHLHILAKN